jgi:hypothetical protein
MKESLDDLAAAGSRERIRLVSAWGDLERTSQHLSSQAVTSVEAAGATLKWGSLAMLGAAVLLRWTKLRSGWKIGKVLWAVTPVLTRLAAPRGGLLSHFFGRGNSEKG